MMFSSVATRGVGIALLCALSQQPTPPPRFESRVDLLRIDVTVLDGKGQPVRDLDADDFRVEVDGRLRKVVFANAVGPALAESKATARSSATLPSHALNTASPAGRAVVFVLDLESIRGGYEKPLLDTAARLVESLGPNDAVALMPIPGKSVELTREHQRVSEALRLVRGTTRVPFTRHYFTIPEATAWEARDRRVMREVIERECPDWDRACPSELGDEVRELLRYARMHVQTVLGSVASLARSLQRIEAPKTIVLISGGLPFEAESLTWFIDAQRALTGAGITVYAVQVAQPDADASNMRRPGVGLYQSADVQTGLANVATMAGGAMYAGIGTASGVFERLRAEIVHAYTLGVESTSADADGKPHSIRVAVARPDVSVRSRREIVIRPDAPDPMKRLANLLAQPVDLTDLPVAAGVYTVRGDEPTTVKAIIAAEIGRGVTSDPPHRYALTITKDAVTSFQTNDVATAHDDPTAGAHVVTAAQLAPGRYRLRFVATDAAGRGGTVDLPIGIGLRAAADLQFSDLIVGHTGQGFRPVFHATAGEPIGMLVELYASDPSRFESATVAFELRHAGHDDVVRQMAGTVRSTEYERRRVAEASFDATTLARGEYSISAVISMNGVPTGKVSRAIFIPGRE